MKKTMIVSLLLTFLSLGIYSQSNLVVGSRFINIKYGFSKHSFPTFGEVEYGYMFHEKMYLRGGLAFEHGKVESTVFNIPYLTVDYGWNFLNIKNYVFLNFTIGPHLGLEYIRSDRIPDRKNDTFIFGGRSSIELDVYITSFISLKYEFRHYYSHKSNLGNWYYTNTIGLSYSF